MSVSKIAPVRWKGNEGSNVHESRMSGVENARAQVLVDRAQTKARLETIEKALKNGGNREALSLLVSKGEPGSGVAKTGQPNSPEEKVLGLLLDEMDLTESFGPDHPKVKAIRKKMSFI